LVVLKKVCARGAFGGELGPLACIEASLNIEDKIGDLLRYLLEDLIRIDDSIFEIVGVRVLHDDDGAARLDLIEVKEALVLLAELDVLEEESNVVLGEVSMLIIEFLFDKKLL
jgi:hypothetical protein